MDSLEKRFQNIEINKTRLIPPREETEKQKSKSKFKNFAMVNKNYEEDFIKLIEEYPNALNVFIYLVFCRNKYTNECEIKIKKIMESIEINKNTVIKSLKILEKYDFIKSFKEQTHNIYIINDLIIAPINKKLCFYQNFEEKEYKIFNNFFKINYTLENKEKIKTIISKNKYSLPILIFLLFKMDKFNTINITKKEIKETINIKYKPTFNNALTLLEESNFIISERDIHNNSYIFKIDYYIADNKN